MTDHCALPRGPDGGIGVPRNEDGIYRPETWEQAYQLMIAMIVGAVPVEQQFDLSALLPVMTADEIVATQPMTATTGDWWRWERNEENSDAD